MTKYEGVIGYISSSPKYGSYSCTLKGVDGFFRLGKDKPKFKPGAFVKFEADDKKVILLDTLEASFREEPASTAASFSAPKTIIDPRYEQDKARQRSIHFQSAHKDAIAVATLALQHDSFKLPQTVAHRYDALLLLVDTLTVRFFGQFEAGSTVLQSDQQAVTAKDTVADLEEKDLD